MKYLALDIESIGLRPFGGTVWIISAFDGRKKYLFHNCNGLTRKDLPADFVAMLESEDTCKIIQNGVFDIPYLECVLGIRVTNVWDTYACETLIQGIRVVNRKNKTGKPVKNQALIEQHSAALEHILPRYGFPKPDKSIRNNFADRPLGLPFTKAELTYAADDVLYLPAIQKAQEFILRRDGMLELALMENKVTEALGRMRVRGIGFDSAIWKRIAYRNEMEFRKRQAALPDTVANWNSPKQVKDFFLSKGIFIESFDDILKVAVKANNDILNNFISSRELHKAVTSYGNNWFEEGFIDADSRIRCDVTQIIDTGRMSMSNPNLQQLPSGGLHRSAFVARSGHSFIIGDFSGQEIGIMAAGSNERIWIEAMLRGDDIHALTASLIYVTEWNSATEKGCTFPKKCKCKGHNKLRTPAKMLNFSLAYGGGPQKFADEMGIEMFEAKVIVKRFKAAIPRLTAWLDKNSKMAINTGEAYSASPYKRRRILRGEETWKIANQGKNTPIQGAGADMIKLALISMPDTLPVVLLIHDEIICEVPDKQVKAAIKAQKQIMEQAADYITGIKGLIKVEPHAAKNLLKN